MNLRTVRRPETMAKNKKKIHHLPPWARVCITVSGWILQYILWIHAKYDWPAVTACQKLNWNKL